MTEFANKNPKDINKLLKAKYEYSEKAEYYKKNCIEILVELGEFINETKVFKYLYTYYTTLFSILQ